MFGLQMKNTRYLELNGNLFQAKTLYLDFSLWSDNVKRQGQKRLVREDRCETKRQEEMETHVLMKSVQVR